MIVDFIRNYMYNKRIRYHVIVCDSGMCYTSSKKKAEKAYRDQVKFASLFSQPQHIQLVICTNGEKRVIHECVINKEKFHEIYGKEDSMYSE